MSETKTTYKRRLADPRWQKRRLEVLNRDNFTCVLCGAKSIELQIHHEVYNGEPWDVPIEKLHTCCADCHKAITLIEKNHFKLPSFPDKSFKHMTYFSDNQYTLDKVSFKIGKALYICYFPTGHYDTFSSEDISQFYHLMMI